MDEFAAEAHKLIGDRVLQLNEEERGAVESMLRKAIAYELAGQMQAFVASERGVVQLVRGEVKRLLN